MGNNVEPKKFSDFDAVVELWPFPSQSVIKGFLVIEGEEKPVSVYRYTEEGGEVLPNQYFVCIHVGHPLSLSWNDAFKILDRKNGSVLFHGRVLLPFEGEIKQSRIKRRLELLRGLAGDEKEMVLASTRSSGVKGLTEKTLSEFTSLNQETLFKLCRQLEAERKIRILSFSPLFLLSQDSFDFLCKRVLAYLSEFHEKFPEDFGVSPDKIQKRFGLPQRVLALALKHLGRTGQISATEKSVALRDFYPLPSPEEEKLLRDMEAIYLEGELRSVSLAEIQRRFSFSKKKLNRMLSFLVERQKIVLGKDGFLIHSKWLDEVIQEVCSSGKEELSVADFKQMTGLTRKYAIPLLELLDQMGVTQRRGPTREIIGVKKKRVDGENWKDN
jgi:selenocysteine-specific elongation factor